MNKFIVVSVLSFSSLFLFSQDKKGYELNIEIENLTDSVAFLSYYYGKGQYYRDTALIEDGGKIVFKSNDDTLIHGLYSLILNNIKLFDFIVDNQNLSLQTDTQDIVGNMKIKNSIENELFYDYLSFIEVRQEELQSLTKEGEEADEKRKKEIEERLTELDNEVKAYMNRLHKEYPGSFTSNFVNAMGTPEIPDPPKDENGVIDSTFQFRYYRDHFFDNIDFTDERLLRTSIYHEKIARYLSKLTSQVADSVIKAVDIILEKAAKNKTLFQYTLSTLTYEYERSQQMGMDAVFVHLAKNYFMKGRAKEWFTDKQLNKLAERANALDPLLIGKKAPNIVVKDTAQKKFLQLYDIESPFIVVYIWSPECGHCKVSTPKLKELYDKYRDQGVEVFGVNNEFENESWIKFINKHKLDWINGSDGGDFRSNFRALYDVYSTPQTYLLDKDKKILSKRMSVESLDKILEYFIEKKEKDDKKVVEEN